MPEKRRKCGFYELDKGRMAQEFQRLFERAQVQAAQTGAKVGCVLGITIGPPDSMDARFGSIAYSMKLVAPARKSPALTTELNPNGLIIKVGDDMADVLQEELELPDLEPAGKKGNGTHGSH